MRCILYRLRSDKKVDEEEGTGTVYTVYGIEVWEKGRCIQSIEDVFLDLHSAEEFVLLCNQLKLNRVHLMDAVMDALEQ